MNPPQCLLCRVFLRLSDLFQTDDYLYLRCIYGGIFYFYMKQLIIEMNFNLRTLSVLFTLSFTWHYSTAQILKVDKGSISADSSRYFLGSLDFNFNLNNRSTTKEREITFRGLTAAGDLAYISKQHAYILINNINYFSSTGGPFISTGYAHFRWNLLRKTKISYEIFSQIQYDEGRNMPLRLLQGGGLRYQLKEKGKVTLYIGTGAMHEKERWNSLTVENTSIIKEIWKTSNYINAKTKVNEHVDFDGILYYQAGFDARDELFRNRISGDLSLSMSLNDRLYFTTNFTGQFEDKPIIPINRLVYALTNGLRLSF